MQTTVKSITTLCLYGNDGGDYKETKIDFIIKSDSFYAKATIHHSIEDVDNGEEIFNNFLKELQSD